MPIVDFATFPDRNELREELSRAVRSVELGDASLVDPQEATAAVSIALPDDLDDGAVRERAEEVRAALQAELGDDASVRFEIAGGEPGTAGGGPDHLE